MLLAVLADRERDKAMHDLMLEDLQWSASRTAGPVETAAGATLDALRSTRRRPADVAVVTVKQRELAAAKLAFGLTLEARPSYTADGASFWHTTIVPESGPPALNVVITMSGESGNDAMRDFLPILLKSYDVRFCVLVGMAAGVDADRSKPGDVMFARMVVDCTHRRLLPTGPVIRPRPYRPKARVVRALRYFDPIPLGWHQHIADLLTAVARGDHAIRADWLPPADPAPFAPTFEQGNVLSDDDLIEDDSLVDRASEVGDPRDALVADMESAGFAATCETANADWIVARGIADFGPPGRERTWQFLASLATAVAVRLWLRHHFRDLADPS
jgi:nucleoside phosphorylase